MFDPTRFRVLKFTVLCPLCPPDAHEKTISYSNPYESILRLASRETLERHVKKVFTRL